MRDQDLIDRAAAFAMADGGCVWPEWLVYYHLEIPLSCRQAVFEVDASDRLTGFLVWAFVGDDVHEDLCSGETKILHLSEWNEGLHAWAWVVLPRGRFIPSGIRKQLRLLNQRAGGCCLGIHDPAGLRARYDRPGIRMHARS